MTIRTDNSAVIAHLDKRIAEIEAERDALQKNLSSTEAFYVAAKERAKQAEQERDAAMESERQMQARLQRVVDAQTARQAERDVIKQSRARLVKLLCAIDETLPTDGAPHYHGLMGRLNLLNSRLEYAKQGLLDYQILRVSLTERMSKAEAERDTAIKSAIDAMCIYCRGGDRPVKNTRHGWYEHTIAVYPIARDCDANRIWLMLEGNKTARQGAQPAIQIAFPECPECGMTHAPGGNTLCSQ